MKEAPESGSTWRTRWRAVRDIVWPIGAVLAVVVPLRSAVADWNDVPTGSMRPTILEGERIHVDELAYGLRVPLTHTWLTRRAGPERGDIVTLASPEDGERLVKRIVAVPGDRIEMRRNRLWLNGEPVAYALVGDGLHETGLPGEPVAARIWREDLPGRSHVVTWLATAPPHDRFGAIVVPDDHYLFLGDNRDLSRDSRFVGLVHSDRIYGRVRHVVVSFDPERNHRPRWNRWLHALE